MNCPTCGSETKTGHQYCRSCGTELMGGPLSKFDVRAWGLIVLMMIFGGLLVAMAGKLWATKWVIFVGLLIMFGGIFANAAYGLLRQIYPIRSKLAAERDSIVEEENVLRADTTNKLLPIGENDFIPSAVESTTDLLNVPASRDSENVNR